MRFIKKNQALSKNTTAFETIIGESTRIDGNLSISQSIRIDGNVNGNILQIEGKQISVAIAISAKVIGDIRADNIILAGKVTGNIFTQNMVEILSTAEIVGDITYAAITTEGGALIKGSLIPMNKPPETGEHATQFIDQIKQKASNN